MPKSPQTPGDGVSPPPPPSGACRKDELVYITDAKKRKDHALSRILSLMGKAKQLSLKAGYRVTVAVQPPVGELPNLFFSTTNSFFTELAELNQRFSSEPRPVSSVDDLDSETRLTTFIRSSKEPALLVPEQLFQMVSAARKTSPNQAVAATKPALAPAAEVLSSGGEAALSLSAAQQSSDPQPPHHPPPAPPDLTPPSPPAQDPPALDLSAAAAVDSGLMHLTLPEFPSLLGNGGGWRLESARYGLMPVPACMLK